jgi:glycosyltransferase involved in cell wall biosynthesis
LRVILNGTLGSPRAVESAYAPNALTLARPCVTTLCGLEHRKGVHDVIEAFAHIAHQHPDWRLIVAGDGPERQPLQAQATKTGCADRIDFIGHVDAPMTILSQSDVFVQASYAEPFGLSILEAREAGCAIIGTRVGGIAEQLGADRYGQTVPPGRPDLIAEELRRLMADPAALQTAQRRAREDLSRYSAERMAQEYSDLYQAAILGQRYQARVGSGSPAD